jgi:uncharacterized membrane protein
MASEPSEPAAQLPGAPKLGFLRAIEPTGTTRVETLSDGVFAVAMTLLILDVKLPPVSQSISAAQYSALVFALWPKLVIFVCSFVVLSQVWIIHRYLFHLLKACDQLLLFWNFLVLIFVSCLPLATSLAGEYPHFSLSAAIYAGNLLAMHLAYRGLWYHASRQDYLMKGDVDPAIPKSVRQRFDFYFLLVTGALVVSYFSSIVSIGLIVAYEFLMFFGQPLFKGRAV